jgi:amino acid permease
MRKERNEQLEIEFGASSDKVVKVIAQGFAGLVVMCGVLAGSVFLMNRPAGNPEVARWNLPSLQGLLLSASSGGRLDARQFDNMMEGVCSNMAGVSTLIRGGEDDSASRAEAKRAQRHCRNGKF